MTIKLHHLRPAPGSKTDKIRVGRGEGSKGKTAGRGTKGTKARKNVPAGFEGGQMPLHMRLPEAQGLHEPHSASSTRSSMSATSPVCSPRVAQIGVDELVAKGAVRKNQLVKVLGDGELSVAVQVTADKFSGSAKEKIAAAGGTTTEL